eukprot:GHVO01027179.1.p1 GENE.GHVO01027179.1~~GHVO01027179.1.p1  ORF type:complete len:101 (-),score=23.73 GHVO01027179.1:61-363(-)
MSQCMHAHVPMYACTCPNVCMHMSQCIYAHVPMYTHIQSEGLLRIDRGGNNILHLGVVSNSIPIMNRLVSSLLSQGVSLKGLLKMFEHENDVRGVSYTHT